MLCPGVWAAICGKCARWPAPTIINYVPFIRSFLEDRFGAGPATLSRLVCRRRCEIRTASSTTTAHEASETHDHRIAFLPGLCAISWGGYAGSGRRRSDRRQLVDDIDPPGDFRGAVRQLLASIDRSTAVGRRDYAILLLLARLGLRSGEVAFLELDEIDWKAGQLSVRGKSGQRNDLPLPMEVGKAIAAYLR